MGKEISHLWTLHICNLSSWPLHKTQNFLCSHKTLDTTILISSDGIRMFFSFHNKNHLVMSCIYIFSYKSSLEDISPTSIRYYSKISMHQCHYDSKGILSWDCIKFLTITYPFLCIKPFCQNTLDRVVVDRGGDVLCQEEYLPVSMVWPHSSMKAAHRQRRAV